MTDLARRVWNQKKVPVVLRREGKGEKLRVRLPFSYTNWAWLEQGHTRKLSTYDRQGRFFELPKAWFNDFVERALAHYGELWIIQPYHETEVCAPACRNAQGHECSCSCMGENHGVGDGDGWFDVSEVFSFRQGPLQLACRHLKLRTP